MSNRKMAGRTWKRASHLLLIVIAFATVGTGCSASITKTDAGPWKIAVGVAGTVNVVTDAGVALPDAFVRQVGESTGVSLRVLPTDGIVYRDTDTVGNLLPIEADGQPVDLYLGALVSDETVADAQVVGDEDACVLADTAWYSANKLPIPTDLETLGEDALVRILSEADPALSNLNAANMVLWRTQLAGLSDSGEGTPRAVPGRIGSSLEPTREAAEGIGSRYRVVDGTCVAVGTYVVPVGEDNRRAANRVVEFLASDEGQTLAAEHAVTYSLAGPTETGPSDAERPVAADVSEAHVVDAAELWVAAFR